MSQNWFEPAKGEGSTATITMSNAATRFNASNIIRMSMGTNSVATMTVNDGTVNGSQLVLGHGSASVSTFTVAGGSAGFNGTRTLTNGNLIGYAAGSSGTLAFTGGTTTFAGPTIVGGIGTISGGGVSRGLVKVEGGVITTNTAASGLFSSVLENHFILGRYAPTTGEMVMTGGTFTAQRDFYVGGSGTGTLTLSGGRMQVGRLSISSTVVAQMSNAGGAGSVTVSSGTLLVTGSLVNDGTLIFNRGSDVTYRGVISGTGAVIKRGGINWLTFTATNTYAGLTSVEEGTLLLSGSGSLGTGGLSLAAGATFDLANLTSGTYSLPATGNLLGSGTVTGSGKTLAVLGNFLPGSSATGTFTAGSGLTLDLLAAAGSTFQLTDPAFAAGTYDLVAGTGSVLLGGPLTLDFTNGPFVSGTNLVRLFTSAVTLTGDFASVTATGLGSDQLAVFDPTTGFVSIETVPEPTTLAAAGMAVAVLALRTWRRRTVGRSQRT